MTTPQADLILRHLRRMAAHLEELSDLQLLRRYVEQRDEEAFARLMGRHQRLVQGAALRVLGNWHDSEDVTQAAFLVLARKAASLRGHDLLACWLYRVAYHLALRAKAASDRRHAKERQAVGRTAPDTFDDIRLSEARTLLDEELAALPQRYRAPILLCCLEAATQEEAARQLGCSLATFKRRLAKGRELLRLRLARRGLTLSTALMPALLAPEPSAAAVTTLSNPSAGALALAEGALRAMTAAKWKMAVVLLLAASVLTAGTGLLMPQVGSQPQALPPVAAADQPKAGVVQETRKDCYGDDLPPGALARLGTVRFRGGGDATDLSPDGRRLITAGHMVDVTTGKEIYPLPQENRSTTGYAAVFSPGGQTFATGGFFGFSLWKTSTGEQLYSVKDWGSVISLAFAPDGKTLATNRNADGTEPALWEAASGKKIAQLEVQGAGAFVQHGAGGCTLAFAPSGRLLASTCGDGIILWDVAMRKEVRRLMGHGKPVHPVVFSPDGKWLASGGEDKTIRLWETATGRELRRLQGHEAPVKSLVFSPDGKTLISGSSPIPGMWVWERRALRLWDVASGEERGTIDGHRYGACSLALSKDGKLLIASDGGCVRLWDPATRREVRRLGGHRSGIGGIAFAPDGIRLATAGGDGTVRLWDAATGRELHVFDASSAVCSVAFSPDGRWIAGGGYEGDIHLWDVVRGREIRRIRGDKSKTGVYYVEFSSDGATLASASAFMSGALWDVATGKELLRLSMNTDGEFFGEREGRMVGKGPDATRSLVRGSDVALVKRLHAMLQGRANFMVSAATISADGTLMANTGGSCHERTTLWEAGTSRELGTIRGSGAAVAISPDGRSLAIGGSYVGTVGLWEVATLKKRAQFTGHRASIGGLAFSPDGRVLASASGDTTALLWDVYGLHRSPQLFDGEKCWQALADDDSVKAYQAIADLTAHPEQAVRLLRQRLQPVRLPEPQLLARLLAELDDDRFQVREKAMKQIEEIGEAAKPALQKALADKPSLEVRRRVEQLLSLVNVEPAHSPEQLRILRAVEVLELLGTPEARRLLETLADGVTEARLTREAKASLARLAR